MPNIVTPNMPLNTARPGNGAFRHRLDVFDDHDGVIDHDADRQHQAEERQVVQRIAEAGPPVSQ